MAWWSQRPCGSQPVPMIAGMFELPHLPISTIPFFFWPPVLCSPCCSLLFSYACCWPSRPGLDLCKAAASQRIHAVLSKLYVAFFLDSETIQILGRRTCAIWTSPCIIWRMAWGALQWWSGVASTFVQAQDEEDSEGQWAWENAGQWGWLGWGSLLRTICITKYKTVQFCPTRLYMSKATMSLNYICLHICSWTLNNTE